LGEAHELVDDDLISDEDFGDFTFANSVRLHGRMNPDFFKGTVIEAEAAAVLKGD
ncbi:MAG: amidohydrolase, partial [Rhodospirillaceae bacterium]|nr:amidohydrolase [Rhodospirillaceae bacterium]